jgi:phosphatidylserine/phosphatidylglycerophosphate/cardiolipin synthase-like enzyme
MDLVKLAAAEAAAAEWEEANQLADAGDDERRPVIDLKEFAVDRVLTAVSPDCSFRLLRDALVAAETEIVIYIYNLTADHVLNILHDRLEKGVKLWIMYDARDVRGKEVEKMEKLAAKGAEVKVAPSTGGRKIFSFCHQKYVVVDRKVVVLGSANWAGSSLPNVTAPNVFRKGNREWLVRVDDVPLA